MCACPCHFEPGSACHCGCKPEPRVRPRAGYTDLALPGAVLAGVA